jgi:DNA-binding XRE family transcriptional regulator
LRIIINVQNGKHATILNQKNIVRRENMKTFDDLRNELATKDPDLFISLEIVGKLMAARDRKKVSQRQLSKLSGVPQKTISRIENGIDVPKLKTLFKLADALDLQLELSLVEKKTNEEQAASITH